jgi:hypothetical protein
MTFRNTSSTHTRRFMAPLIDRDEVTELIRLSNRLRHQSNAIQQAATRASVVFRDVVRRSVEVCGK